MSDITLETVQQTAEDAMKAFSAFQTEVKGKLGKLDALDEAKLGKMGEDISSALELSQKHEAKNIALESQVKQLEAAFGRVPNAAGDAEKEAKEARKAAFNDFLKKGTNGSKQGDFADYIELKSDLPQEIKALSVNNQANGGYLVLPEFGGIIDVRVFESSPMRALAGSVQIATDSLELVLDNDEAASGWVGETTSRPETSTPTLDKKIIVTHELYANPRATQKMLDDSIVDVEGWLAGKVAAKFARDEATAFVSGDGVSKPFGILDTSRITTSTSYSADKIQQIASTTQGVIVYNDLVNVQNALKEPYQGNATWMLKRATLGYLMKIKSGITDDNTPIFNMQYDKNAGLEMTLLTRPVRFADDMPAVANDVKAIAYGDFRAGYLIVDRIGIRTLRDPYSGKPYVQFYTTKRVGGDVVTAEALKVLGLTG